MTIVFFTYKEIIENYPGRVLIVPKDSDNFPLYLNGEESIKLAPARVLGLSYPDYLLFIRQMFPEDVVIELDEENFPMAYWRKGQVFYTFLELLNSKLTLALKDKEMLSYEAEIREQIINLRSQSL